MPSDDEQTRPVTKPAGPADHVAKPAQPDLRHNRPEPAAPDEGLRVLYG